MLDEVAEQRVPARERAALPIQATCIDSAATARRSSTTTRKKAPRAASTRSSGAMGSGRSCRRPRRASGASAAPGAALHRRRRRRQGAVSLAPRADRRGPGLRASAERRNGATRSFSRSSRASASSKSGSRACPCTSGRRCGPATKGSTWRSMRSPRCGCCIRIAQPDPLRRNQQRDLIVLHLLEKPPLGRVPRSMLPSRSIAWLDAAAAWILWCCWVPINYALFAAVHLVLLAERWHRVISNPRFDEQGRFWCPWCGQSTAELEAFPLSCCRMAFHEWMRKGA
jgi:hypothetical protein